MWGAGRFFTCLLSFLFLASAAAAPQAEETPDTWYLISEAELRSIERYKEKSEAEKRNWLSRVKELRVQADSLQRESAALNGQLRNQRERNRILEQSYNESETGWLTLVSLKNGEIAGLKREAADKDLEAAAYKSTGRTRLFIITALGAAWAVYIAFKACRFFKLF
jgi:hypothetical protein